jgi:hypothetical protein
MGSPSQAGNSPDAGPRKHPFREFFERILFLARRGSETVGRIAGIIDSHYNQFQKTRDSNRISSRAAST